MDKKLETLSPQAKKSLASWLRRRFEGSVPPHLLAKISDDLLIERYFQNAEEKRQSLANLKIPSDVID